MVEEVKPPPASADTEDASSNTIKAVSDDELAIAYSGPAVLANKFYVTLTPAGPRIAFTEVHGDQKPQFRTAVVLPHPDAVALYELLGRMLKENVATFSVEDLPPEFLAKLNATKG